MATFRELLVKQYANDIYKYGNRTFQTINPTYIQEVKQYAANNFTKEEIDKSLAKEYITQAEYDETIALIPVV